jgi:hypothetical protein
VQGDAARVRNNAVQKSDRQTRKPVADVTEGKTLSPRQVEIWEKAVAYCVRQLPTLWTVGEPKHEPVRGWIIPIVLCYPDGFEGELGEMAYDEEHQEFTLLSDKATLAERARVVAASRASHGKKAAASEARA